MMNQLASRGLAVPIAVLALTAGLLSPALAQGPNNKPKSEGTIKAMLSTDPTPVFERQMRLIADRRASWLAKASQATPKLLHTPKHPVAVVNVVKDAACFQGWKTVVSGKPESVCNRPLSPGDSFILDFGEHIARRLILLLRSFDIPVDAKKPVTPYMHHYVVEALQVAGLDRQATDLLRSYWGGMVRKGADTFWEVYVPGDDRLSPYKSHLMNSYCHAWSCTPTYFLRKDQNAGAR